MQYDPCFSPEYLSSLSYNDSESLIIHLKSLANKLGFKLSQKDSINNYYIRLYCSKANISKGENKSTKTGCEFKVIVLKKKFNNIAMYHISQNSCLQHNHELYPNEFVLDNDTQKRIKNLRDIGLSPILTENVLLKLFGIHVSTREIERFTNKAKELQICETDQLDAYMKERGGSLDFYCSDDQKRVAALSITNEENENLKKYGDVLFIDSTSIENSLNWSIIPIIVIDEYKHIQNAGVCFLAWETEEVYLWLLDALYAITGNKWKTLFTDQDSAIMSAIPPFIDDKGISHYICWFHKRNNLSKHLNCVKAEKDLRNQMLVLFDKLSFSMNENEISRSIEDMKIALPCLSQYISDEIEYRIPWFAALWKGSSLTLGYRSTSPSESANNMIKSSISKRSMTLLEIRIEISNAFSRKNNKNKDIIKHSFTDDHFLFKQYGLKLSRPIYCLIDKAIHRSLGFKVKKIEDGDYIVYRNEKEFRVNKYKCSCMKSDQNGYPCSHIIALYSSICEDFPISLINERWIIDRSPIETPNRQNERDPYRDSPKQFKPIVKTNIEKYNKLLYIGKEIARRAANSSDYEDVEKDLKGILEKYGPSLPYSPQSKENIGKKRGRPKKANLNQKIGANNQESVSSRRVHDDESFFE